MVRADENDYLAAMFDPNGRRGGGCAADPEFGRATAALTTVAHPDFARVTGTLYEDLPVQVGVAYTYTVRTASGALIGVAEVIGGDMQELQPLIGLNDTVEDGTTENAGVALRWKRPLDAPLVTSYNLYRLDDEGAVMLNPGPFVLLIDDGSNEALFVDEAVEVGESYTYVVEGIDLFGRVTPRSEPVTIVLPDPSLLALPQIGNGDLTITIEWAPPQDKRVRAIGVRRCTDPDGPPDLLTERLLATSATSFTDRDVVGGVDYYYTLVSIDGSGRGSAESGIWAERAYNPTPPSAPSQLSVIEGEDGLTLTWAAAPEIDVGSYRVYMRRQGEPEMDDFCFADATVDTSYLLAMEPGSLSELHVVVTAVNTSDVEKLALGSSERQDARRRAATGATSHRGGRGGRESAECALGGYRQS